MLRITTEENDSQTRFRLEGRLKGDWVRELEGCWRSAANTEPNRQFSVDLSSVDFIDESGKDLLTRMASHRVLLETHNNLMISAVVEEVMRGSSTQSRAVRVKQ